MTSNPAGLEYMWKGRSNGMQPAETGQGGTGVFMNAMLEFGLFPTADRDLGRRTAAPWIKLPPI